MHVVHGWMQMYKVNKDNTSNLFSLKSKNVVIIVTKAKHYNYGQNVNDLLGTMIMVINTFLVWAIMYYIMESYM